MLRAMFPNTFNLLFVVCNCTLQQFVHDLLLIFLIFVSVVAKLNGFLEIDCFLFFYFLENIVFSQPIFPVL